MYGVIIVLVRICIEIILSAQRKRQREREGDSEAKRTLYIRICNIITAMLCVCIECVDLVGKHTTQTCYRQYRSSIFSIFLFSLVKYISRVYTNVIYFIEHAVLECTANNGSTERKRDPK